MKIKPLILILHLLTLFFAPIVLSANEIRNRQFCSDQVWSEFWQNYNGLSAKEKTDKSPLRLALDMRENLIAMELVSVYGYEAFPDLRWCLVESFSHEFDELPLLMIDQGLDPSYGDSLLLSFAAKWGREELLFKLLSLGVNPNGIPQWAWPALNELATNTNSSSNTSTEKRESNLRMAKALIDAGADVNGSSRPGYNDTPLFIACSSCYGPDFSFVQFLLEEGADPNIVEYLSGETPFLRLFWMCDQCSSSSWRSSSWDHKCFWTLDCLKCIKLFISYGIDVNLQNKDGNTALIYLLQKHPGDSKISMEILEILLESGADLLLPGLLPLSKTHRDWLTPMDYARARGFEKHLKYMTDWLIEYYDPWIK